MSSNGTYTFTASTQLFGDANTGNDAMAPSSIVISTLTPGTVSLDINNSCGSGTGIPTLTTSSTGGDIQWYASTVSSTGPYTAVGTNSTTYTPSLAPTQTTYYMALISCNAVTASSLDTALFGVPQIVSVTGATRCGFGTVTLGATAGLLNSVRWYAAASGGDTLATGANFTTPSISTTTTYYASAVYGETTASGLGNLQIPTATGALNERGLVINLTRKSKIVTAEYYSPTTSVTNTVTVKVINHITGVQIGSNLVIPVTQTTAGWYTLNLNFDLNPGTYRLLASFSQSVNRITTGVDYTNSTFNNLGIFGSILSGYDGAVTATSYNYFHNISITSSCESSRTPVVATVNAPPSLTISSSSQQICNGLSSNTVSITSNVADFDNYVWSPSVGVTGNSSIGYTFNPTSTTTFTLTGTQTSGGQCSNTASHAITVNPLPTALVASPDPVNYCAGAAASAIALSGGLNTGTFVSGTATTT
ncbi:MAG: hypothetical protein ACOVOV_11130, partial [Dolichospermum sp.]